MNRLTAIVFLMLIVIGLGMVVGFNFAQGPQKQVGFAMGWLMGSIVAGLLAKSNLGRLAGICGGLAVTFLVFALLSAVALMMIWNSEVGPIHGLLTVVAVLMTALALSFGTYAGLGTVLRSKFSASD